MRLATTLVLGISAAVVAAALYVRFGIYNVGADDPHWPATHAALGSLRNHSIAARAAKIVLPDLTDEDMIRRGAGNYDSMCAGCHLRPGVDETELSLGLYPRPPTWSDLGSVDPREAFWAIKHGIKMTGMPAWGKSMEDRYIWDMVAFIARVGRMNEATYVATVEASPGHSHGGGETHMHGAKEGGRDDSTRSHFEPVDDPMSGDRSETSRDSDADHPHESTDHPH